MVYQIPNVTAAIHQGATRFDAEVWDQGDVVFRYQIQTPGQKTPVPNPVAQTSPIPPVITRPEGYFIPFDVNRHIWEGPEQFFDGAIKQQTSPIPPVTTRPEGYFVPFDFNRFFDQNDLGRTAQIDGATKQQTFPVPPVTTGPHLNYYVPFTNSFLDQVVKRYEGATKLQTFPVPPVTTKPDGYFGPFDPNRY